MTQTRCRLYLTCLSPTPSEQALRAALEGGDVACVMLAPDGDRRLVNIAQEAGAAVLIDGDISAARALRADGVHIAGDEVLYAEARNALGSDAIVGAACGTSRHRAMVLAEAGAAYLAFGDANRTEERAELIAWCAELIEVPCVAWEVAGIDEGAALAQLGADFVAVGDAVWAAPSPAEAVRAFNAALGRAKDAA